MNFDSRSDGWRNKFVTIYQNLCMSSAMKLGDASTFRSFGCKETMNVKVVKHLARNVHYR